MKPLLERIRGGLGWMPWLALLAGILVVAVLNLLLALLLPSRLHAGVGINIVAAVLAAGIAPYLLRTIDRINRQVERQNSELKTLHALDNALGSQSSLQAILDVAVKEATLAVDGELGGLWLLDAADAGRVDARSYYNVVPERQGFLDEHLEATSGPPARKTGLPQRRQEIDATWPRDRAAHLLRLRSTLTIPVRQQDTLLGLLLVGNRGGASPLAGFTGDDEALLVATASSLSVAVQNARLSEETRRRGEMLRALVSHTGDAVAASSDAPRLMQILADAAAQILSCPRVAVYSYVEAPPRLFPPLPTEFRPLAFHYGTVRADAMLRPSEGPLQLDLTRARLLANVDDGGGRAVRYVPDVGQTLGLSPQDEPFLASPGYLFVLRSRDRRGIGLLCLLDDAPHPASPDRDAFAQALSAQASVGLENALLGEQLQIAYERDKHVAEVFQRSMLPPVPARIGTFAFAQKYQAALEESTLGGDFYDLFPLGPDLMGVVMADVSGKGLKAAVQTAMVKYMLRGFAHETPHEPGAVLARVNDVLSRDTAGFEGFVTLFFGALDTASGDFIYANAGHEPPLWREASTAAVTPLEADSGLPLGSLADTPYASQSRRFAPGDALLLYTDGLPESRSPEGLFLGTDGLSRLAADSLGGSDAPGAVESLYRTVRAFAGDTLRDDVALLLLLRAG